MAKPHSMKMDEDQLRKPKMKQVVDQGKALVYSSGNSADMGPKD